MDIAGSFPKNAGRGRLWICQGPEDRGGKGRICRPFPALGSWLLKAKREANPAVPPAPERPLSARRALRPLDGSFPRA